MQKICYVEEPREGFLPPPGYKTRNASGEGAMRGTGWFRRKPSAQWLLVYKDQCQLPLDEMELVSFVHDDMARGYVCSCDLTIEIIDPELLIADLAGDDGMVTKEALNDQLRPHVMEILKDAGKSRDLENQAAWTTFCDEVRKRLRLPRGTSLKEEDFRLREVSKFDKRIEEVRIIAAYRLALEAADRDGRIKRAVEKHREKELLAELGEHRVRSLLTRRERRQPAAKRLETYLKIVGMEEILSRLIELQKSALDLHVIGVKILDRVVAIIEKDKAEKDEVPVPTPSQQLEALQSCSRVVGGSELAAVLDKLEQLQLNELSETLDELESLQAVQGKE